LLSDKAQVLARTIKIGREEKEEKTRSEGRERIDMT
jgi:hypothetical protein